MNLMKKIGDKNVCENKTCITWQHVSKLSCRVQLARIIYEGMGVSGTLTHKMGWSAKNGI